MLHIVSKTLKSSKGELATDPPPDEEPLLDEDEGLGVDSKTIVLLPDLMVADLA